MSDYEIIGRQSCIIYKLEEELKEIRKRIDIIQSIVYNKENGPLGGNRLQFNIEQQSLIHKLMGYLDFTEGA